MAELKKPIILDETGKAIVNAINGISKIDDNVVSANATWSSEKINTVLDESGKVQDVKVNNVSVLDSTTKTANITVPEIEINPSGATNKLTSITINGTKYLILPTYTTTNNNQHLEVQSGNLYWKDPQLPSGYRRVSCIVSSGTQWINTGVIPNRNTEFEIDFYPKDAVSSTGHCVFSVRESSTGFMYSFSTFNTTTTGYFGYGNNKRGAGGLVANVRLKASFRKGHFMCNGIGRTETLADYPSTFTYPIRLFAQNTQNTAANEQSSMKLYNFKLYQDGVLIRDFIPCLNASNVAGLYDIVEGKWYPNSGTGSFTYEA